MKKILIMTLCMMGVLLCATMIAAYDGSNFSTMRSSSLSAAIADTPDIQASMQELVDVHERMFQAEGFVGSIVTLQAKAVSALTGTLGSVAGTISFN